MSQFLSLVSIVPNPYDPEGFRRGGIALVRELDLEGRKGPQVQIPISMGCMLHCMRLLGTELGAADRTADPRPYPVIRVRNPVNYELGEEWEDGSGPVVVSFIEDAMDQWVALRQQTKQSERQVQEMAARIAELEAKLQGAHSESIETAQPAPKTK